MKSRIHPKVQHALDVLWERNPEVLAWIVKLISDEQFDSKGKILVGGVHLVLDPGDETGQVQTISAAAVNQDVEPLVASLLVLNALTSQLQHMSSKTLPELMGKEILTVSERSSSGSSGPADAADPEPDWTAVMGGKKPGRLLC